MGHEQEDSLLTGILLHKMRKILKYGSFLLAVAVAAGILAGCSKKAVEVESLPQYDTEVAEGEQIAVMTIRDYGTIKIRFFKEQAPKAVENFITHAKQGYYNELNFHRVIENFMIQGGDPAGTGAGGPDYCIKGEFSQNGFENNLAHTPGVLSMARTMFPDSAGSQFFIMHKAAPHLDGAYAAFGKVTEGLEVVDKIASVNTDYSDKPLQPQRMATVTVETFGVEYPEPEKC